MDTTIAPRESSGLNNPETEKQRGDLQPNDSENKRPIDADRDLGEREPVTSEDGEKRVVDEKGQQPVIRAPKPINSNQIPEAILNPDTSVAGMNMRKQLEELLNNNAKFDPNDIAQKLMGGPESRN